MTFDSSKPYPPLRRTMREAFTCLPLLIGFPINHAVALSLIVCVGSQPQRSIPSSFE